jgi:hypothetical protein
MAFTDNTVAIAATARGPKLDGYAMEVHHYTKLTGDTTGTVYATTLKKVISVQVFDTVGAAIAAGVTINNDWAQSSHKGFGSAALTSLGAGTAGVIVLKGSAR